MIVNELKYLLHTDVMDSMFMSDTCVEYLHVMSVIMYVHTCYMQYKTYCGNAVFLHVMFSFVVTLHTLTRPIAQLYHTNKTLSLANLYLKTTQNNNRNPCIVYFI